MSDLSKLRSSNLSKSQFIFNHLINLCKASNLGVLNLPLINLHIKYIAEILYTDSTQ